MDRLEIAEMMNRQRVMVLSTYGTFETAQEGADACSWAAPVYFVHEWQPGTLILYFQSSPNALHVRHLHAEPMQSAAIFEDHQDWRQIKGLQMRGKVQEVQTSDLGHVQQRYLQKFPWAEPLIAQASRNGSSIRWFALHVVELYQVDNRQGFGRRKVEI